MRYSPDRERIVVAGLAEVGHVRLAEIDGVVQRRKQVCASKKAQYAWLRINPCANLPHIEDDDVPVLDTSRRVSAFLHEAVGFSGRGVEYFMILCVNGALQPMAVAVPHKGGRASSIVDPTVMFQAVVLSGSSGFLVAHNHPSGTTHPSREDVELTRNLKKAAPLLGLRLLDHVILTDDPERFASFADSGLL